MNGSIYHPYTVGLTGGIASGKTQASNCFATLGVEVVDADVIAREMVAPGSPVLTQLVDHFGKQIMHPDGTLDRARLRTQVFNDAGARQVLNAITHPAIASELQKRCQAACSDYVIAAIPLLIESGGHCGRYAWLRRIVVVDVAPSVQHMRLCQRDGIDSALAWKMIAAQASRSQRLAQADEIIVNDGGISKLHAQVQMCDNLYRQLAKTDHTRIHR